MIINDSDIRIISDGTINSFFTKEGYKSQPKNFSLDENQADHYWGPWRVINSAWNNAAAYRSISRDISPSIPGHLLDIGCGPMVKAIKFLVEKVSGYYVGLDQVAALQCAEKFNAFNYSNVVLAHINLDNSDAMGSFMAAVNQQNINTFDAIVCVDVIEHLFNPSIILSMINTMTDSDSRIYFATPERDLKRGSDCVSCEKRDHVREWNTEEFIQLLTHFNFKVEDVEILECSDAKDGDKSTLFCKCKKLS